MVFVENEQAEEQQQSIERSSTGSNRARSLDSSDLAENAAQGGGLRRRRRTCSDEKSSDLIVSNNNKRGSKNMVPLRSVEINPFSPNHPLSALRSCSEFRKDTCSHNAPEVWKPSTRVFSFHFFNFQLC